MYILMFLGEKGEGNDPRKEFWCSLTRNMHKSMFAGHKDSLVLLVSSWPCPWLKMEVVFSWLHEHYKYLCGMSVNSIKLHTNEVSDYEVQDFLEKIGK